MARLSVVNEHVKELVDQHLVQLFLDYGSVNRIAEVMNQALSASASDVRVYPNRIHALLSDDPERSVNEKTIAAVQSALDILSGRPRNRVDTAQDDRRRWQAEVRRRWPNLSGRHSPILELAREVSLPPAVVRHLLASEGLGGSPSASAAVASRERAIKGPDWSFQQVAVERCLSALSASPMRKVGLVLPTGSGKTRVALQVALHQLAAEADASAHVVWITHRKDLRDQAHEKLQELLNEQVPGIPDASVELLAKRVEFIMVSQLSARLAGTPPALIIVDEGHHAAAASYQAIFETSYPLRGLFLTATPNRTDALPIGIDEIAYTLTYRELAERGVILIPNFEDFAIDDFDWSESAIADLADFVIQRSADDFRKILVLAPRIDRVEEFYAALLSRLGEEPAHPLGADDIGFVHGSGNSLTCGSRQFLATFRAKPRAIIVSAELLLEGFDDPAINTVVVTYQSGSLVRLMQAAGRCVRYHPDKAAAYVVQARNDELAYHFDQRWLYQEISDYLRPYLADISYSSSDDLLKRCEDILAAHGVSSREGATILGDLKRQPAGSTLRVLLCGLPYFGDRDAFAATASWTAVLETPDTSSEFRSIFNDFCARGANIANPSDLLLVHSRRFGFRQSHEEGGTWRRYFNMLTAMYSAQQELYSTGAATADGVHRPYSRNGSTTWLKYITFTYEPVIPDVLARFLADCHNAQAIEAEYTANPTAFDLALKLPLPLPGSSHALLLASDAARSFQNILSSLAATIQQVSGEQQFAALAAFRSTLPGVPGIPFFLLDRIDHFLGGTDGPGQQLILKDARSQTVSLTEPKGE